MKKLLIGLLLAFPSLGFCDTKISAFGSTTTLNGTDIIPVVTTPGGTPANKTISFTNLINSINPILNQSTLQSGSTFYTSSGTVNGIFTTSGTIQAYNQQTDPGVGTFYPNIELKKRVGNQGCQYWDDDGGSGKGFYACMAGSTTTFDMGAVSGIAGATSFLRFVEFGQNGAYPFSSTMTILVPLILNGGLTNQFLQTDANSKVVNYDLLNATQTWTGKQAWTSPSPSSFTYQVNVGSITGGGLTTCGDATHGLGYNSSSQFICQSITGAAGGGASTLGISSGSALTSVIISSPTSNVVFSSNTMTISLQGTSTSFVTLNPSSATLQGNAISLSALNSSSTLAGYLASTQTWGGQNNWTTPSPSTFTYGVTVGSMTVNGPGNGVITLTINNSTYTVASSSDTAAIVAGHLAKWSTTNYTLIDGGVSAGGGTPAGNAYDVQVASPNLTQMAGYDNFQNNGTTVSVTGADSGQFINYSSVTYSGYNLFAFSGTTITFDNASPITTASSMTINSTLGVVSNATGASVVTFSTTTTFNHVAISTSGHIITGGPIPVISACGSGSPAVTVGSTDVNGFITTGTGVFSSCTLTFASPWLNKPSCVIEDDSTVLTAPPKVTTTQTTMIFSGVTITAGDVFNYICFGN